MIYIAAHSRLLAQIISNETVQDKDGTKNCKKLTVSVQKYPRLYTTVGSQSNIELLRSSHVFQTLLLVKEGKVIGYMELQNNYYDGLTVKYVVHSVYVEPTYRGQRLGIVLYAGAIHCFKHIASDALIAVGAVRTWHSLAKLGYRVKMWSSSFDCPKQFTWGDDGIPVIDGKSIERTSEEFIFYV
jgi:hypothetical protein